MNCDEIRERLSSYMDQMLEESQIKDVEAHLAACPACKKEYEEIKEILGLFSQVEVVPVPESFEFRLKKALKEESRNILDAAVIGKAEKKRRKFGMITSIAAVFAVGVISFALFDDVLGILPEKLKEQDQSGVEQTEINVDSAQNLDLNNEKSAAPAAEEEPSAKLEDSQPAPYGSSSVSGAQRNAAPEAAGSDVERNTASVEYYTDLIEEKLEDFDYQILDSACTQAGEWQFRIFIFRGKDGNTYNEEILIIGKDGGIEAVSSNEVMNL